MRRTVRALSETTPDLRLGSVIGDMPPAAQTALAAIATREDLPLAAGAWTEGDAGCLVANVVAVLAKDSDGDQRTLDVRVLDLIPELSSRDLNQLIVAWDEAADAARCSGDPSLRRLLRDALTWAGVPCSDEDDVRRDAVRST